MKEFYRLRAKRYRYLKDYGSEDKKTKGTKKYKNCLEATQLEHEINHLEKNEIDIVLKEIIKNS